MEKYLIILQLEKKPINQLKLLTESFAERPNCYKAFAKQNSTLHKKLDALPYRDELYFLEKKDLYLQFYGHPATDVKGEGKETLEKAIKS